MINENLSTVLAIMQRESIRLTTAAITMETQLSYLSTTDLPFYDSGGYVNGIIVTGINTAGVDGDDKSDSNTNDTVIVVASTIRNSVSNTTVIAKTVARSGTDNVLQNVVIIPLYAVIFTCCVLGNLLVILTLAQNKRMRTVTNVYLLNLVSVLIKHLFQT